MRIKKVLVPLDDTTFSLRILPYVIDLFEPEECDLYLLHVEAAPKAVTVNEKVVVYADQAAASIKAEGISALQPYVHSLEALGYHVTPIVTFGDPAAEIKHLSEDMNFDVIAMTTHGRAGFDRFLRGSVTQAVVTHVDLPILLYHASPDDGDVSALSQ